MSTLEIVLSELKKKLKNNNLKEDDIIDTKVIKEILKEDGMYLLDEYSNINTPYALAWYYENWNIQNKYSPLIEKDLKSFLDTSKVNISIYNNFSFKIRLDKKTNIDECKQSIIIKACVSKNENDIYEINYKLIGPDGWGWNISKQQLKALTESNIIISENNIIKKSNFWNKLFKFINFKKIIKKE